jgi:hypothetical protein
VIVIVGIRQFLHPESRFATTISPELGPKIRQGALKNVSHGAGEALVQHRCESQCKHCPDNVGENDWKLCFQVGSDEARNVLESLLEVPHPIKATLQFHLHVTNGLLVSLGNGRHVSLGRHQGALVESLESSSVLLRFVLHNPKKGFDRGVHHMTGMFVEHHQGGRFRPNQTNTLVHLGKYLLKSRDATTKSCHIGILVSGAKAIVGQNLNIPFRNLR